MLVDCGASHNFIYLVLVQNLDLQFKPNSSFTVEVGDGRKIPCLGVCSKLNITLQGLQVQQDFYVFDLGNVDIVLGMEWLAQLGEVRANFGDLILKVPTSSGFHVLQGDPTLSRAPASLKTMYKALQASGDGYLLQVEAVSDVSDQHNTIPTWLTTVLNDFQIVFKEIQGLPPSRTHDHAIVLQ